MNTEQFLFTIDTKQILQTYVRLLQNVRETIPHESSRKKQFLRAMQEEDAQLPQSKFRRLAYESEPIPSLNCSLQGIRSHNFPTERSSVSIQKKLSPV